MLEVIDIRSLAFLMGVIGVFLCVSMTYVSLTRKTYPGFHRWTLAYIIGGLGLVFLSLRGALPVFFSVVLANLFLIGYFLLLIRGLIEFCEIEARKIYEIAAILICACLFVYFTYNHPSVLTRMTLSSFFYGAFSLICAALCFRGLPRVLGEPDRVLAGIFSVLGFWCLIAAALTPFLEIQTKEFLRAGPLQSMTVIVGGVATILIVPSLITINAQRLEKELIAARDEIKTLKGILPICANCKKIRDDQGYWQQVETYVGHHSDADFSHSICPECMKKLYPREAAIIEKQKGEENLK